MPTCSPRSRAILLPCCADCLAGIGSLTRKRRQRTVVCRGGDDLGRQRPRVREGAAQLRGLLAHDRSRSARGPARHVPPPQQVTELVVHEHLAIRRQVSGPFRCRGAPSVGVDDDQRAVLARVARVDVHRPAHLLGVVGFGEDDGELGGAVLTYVEAALAPAAGVRERRSHHGLEVGGGRVGGTPFDPVRHRDGRRCAGRR